MSETVRDESVSVKVTHDEAYALAEVLAEYQMASDKHPDFNSAHEGYAVILEEMDELKAEVWKRHKDYAQMRAEAVQVAAIAIRFVVDICEAGR